MDEKFALPAAGPGLCAQNPAFLVKKYDITGRDRLLLPLTLAVCTLAADSFLLHGLGLGVTVTVLAWYALLGLRLGWGRLTAGSGKWLLTANILLGLWYALGSALFASLTAILGKVGISGVESNLGTALRTGVVLLMSWVMVFVTGKTTQLKAIPKNELGFLFLSGLATGASWLCYYKALRDGPASVVVPIDKLSILVTVAFSYLVFHEKLTKKSALGLAAIVAGTLLMLL